MTDDGRPTLSDRFARIEADIADIKDVLVTIGQHDAADAQRFAHIEHRLEAIESWKHWVVRLAMAALIGGAATAAGTIAL